MPKELKSINERIKGACCREAVAMQPRPLLVAGAGPWGSVCGCTMCWECPVCGHDRCLHWVTALPDDDVQECLECGATWTPGYEH